MVGSHMSRSFALAPMSPLIKGITMGLWLLPLVFIGVAIASRQKLFGIVALLLILMYGGVWVWCRPSQFVLSPNQLTIVFPGWKRRIPMTDISSFRATSSAGFNQEFGLPVRIGVGGLWGGFGWLWTSRQGLIEFYVSRSQGFVLIDRAQGKTLLITPTDPQRMIEEGRAQIPQHPHSR